MSVVYEHCHPQIDGKTYKLIYDGKKYTVIKCNICAQIQKKLSNSELDKQRPSFDRSKSNNSDSSSSINFDEQRDSNITTPVSVKSDV
jgi:ribosome-binding protein aMBF1 (putative translation factor)